MKKIVPFTKILTFNTDVSEITAISLEHDIKVNEESIEGTFYITGEYKISDGMLEKEPFNFELPFDIALGNSYNTATLKANVDDFRYELVGHNNLKVNIDLCFDGEIKEDPIDDNNEVKEEARNEEVNKVEITESLDLLDEMLENKQDEKIDIDINNENENIFTGFNEEEKYVTYRVYRVNDGDTIDNITEKYHTSKEELAKYNEIDNIKPGVKLIIPANDK